MITLLLPTLLAVLVPEGAIKPHLYNTRLKTFLVYHTPTGEHNSFWKQHDIELPPGFTQLLGEPSEIQEDVAAGLVEKATLLLSEKNPVPESPVKTKPGFFDYENPKHGFCPTALESLSSLLRSHEVYQVNPFGKKELKHSEHYSYHDYVDNDGIRHLVGKQVFKDELAQWHHAQSRTGKWILIAKPK